MVRDDNYFPIQFDKNGERFTVINSGTAPAPCILTFIPKVDFFTLTIEGLSEEPIVVHRVLAGSTLIIDSESRTVTINDEDAFDRYEAWEFPKLQPGANEVIIKDGVQAAIQIEYAPRYI